MENSPSRFKKLPSPILVSRLFSAARKGHVFGAQSPKTPSSLFWVLREFCSRFREVWKPEAPARASRNYPRSRFGLSRSLP